MTWQRYTQRNTRPARGPDVLTLSLLRHYLRKFWTDRVYGICGIQGGKEAFLRFCGEEFKYLIKDTLLREEPLSEYLPARAQRMLSRKVRQVLRGEVIFVQDSGKTATWRPILGAPEPPVPHELPAKDHEFWLQKTPFGPKIRRL
jgi:hypothetical protein